MRRLSGWVRGSLGGLLLGAVLVACGPAGPSQAPAASAPAAKPAATQPAAPAAGAASGGATAVAPAAQPAVPPAPEPITVSWVNSLTIAPFFVAADRGYFQEQGIELKLEQVQSAADAIAFLATGQLDASFGAVAVAIYNAINQGLNVRVVAPMAYDNPSVLVRKALWDSGAVRQIADLRGRQMYTVAPGSGVAYLRIKALQLHGLSDNDVGHVSVPLPDAPVAMTNGAIDAAFFPEPWHTRVLEQGVAVSLAERVLPNEVLTITAMAGERLLRERPDLGARWMTALMKGQRDLQTREQIMSDDTVAIMSRWTGLQPDVLRQMRHLPRFEPNGYIDTESLLDQQRVHMAAGAISYAEPLPIGRIVDTRLVDAALQQLGRQ